MVLFNYSNRELTAKIVYYGPGLCGKTTNLQYIYENLSEGIKGKMLSLATKTDRTLFFDFLPIEIGDIRGMKTRIQLYTVPGQVFYNETRKLVLKGADGIVFVADSQEQMLGVNVEAFRNLEENLKAHALNLADMPHVLQFNKRDLPRVTGIEQLNTALNRYNAPFYESVATTGIGVQDTLRAIVKLVLLHLTRRYDPKAFSARSEAAPPPLAATPSPVAAAPPPAAATPPRRPAPQKAPPHAPSRPFAFRESPVAERTAGVPVSAVPQDKPAARPSPVPDPPRFFGPMEREDPFAETLSGFGESEIADLVSEVEEAPPEEASVFAGVLDSRQSVAFEAEPDVPAPEPTPSFDLDRSFEADWTQDPGQEPGMATDMDVASAPTGFEPTQLGPAADVPEDTVLLTTAADTSDLFEDPALEIARLSPGETREIQIPVEVREGKAARRLRLSIRLRLDPVD